MDEKKKTNRRSHATQKQTNRFIHMTGKLVHTVLSSNRHNRQYALLARTTYLNATYDGHEQYGFKFILHCILMSSISHDFDRCIKWTLRVSATCQMAHKTDNHCEYGCV